MNMKHANGSKECQADHAYHTLVMLALKLQRAHWPQETDTGSEKLAQLQPVYSVDDLAQAMHNAAE